MVKAQTAIEHVLTYGWMLIIAAVVASVAYTVIDEPPAEAVSGFGNEDIQLQNFGITNDEELQLNLANTRTAPITINSINITSENGENLGWKGENPVTPGDTQPFKIKNVTATDTAETYDATINYNLQTVNNLEASGEIKAAIDFDPEHSWTEEQPETLLPPPSNFRFVE